MLGYLKATNWQQYEELFIEFHEGLNVIIGPSDSGKSSVFRLLHWIFTNHQLRYNYQNDDSKGKRGSRVIGEIGIDNHVVKRVKGKTDNYYQLDSNDPDNAIGNVLPDAINKLFNMDAINIHAQHDKHFLLSETSGKVGQYINKIVNLQILDKTLSYAKTKVDDHKKQCIGLEKDIKICKLNLGKYKWIDSFEKKLDRLEKRDKLLKDKKTKNDKLFDYINSYKKFERQLEQYKDIDKFEQKINKLIIKQKELNRLVYENNELSNLLGEYYELIEEYNDIKYYTSYEDRLEQCINNMKDIERLESEHNKLEKVLSNYKRLSNSHKRLSNEIDLLDKEFNELMPDICPLCNKPYEKTE